MKFHTCETYTVKVSLSNCKLQAVRNDIFFTKLKTSFLNVVQERWTAAVRRHWVHSTHCPVTSDCMCQAPEDMAGSSVLYYTNRRLDKHMKIKWTALLQSSTTAFIVYGSLHTGHLMFTTHTTHTHTSNTVNSTLEHWNSRIYPWRIPPALPFLDHNLCGSAGCNFVHVPPPEQRVQFQVHPQGVTKPL